MAATTATRSTRRADGLHHPHHHPHLYQTPFHQSVSQQSHSLLVAPGTRKPNMTMKRHLPPLERDLDAVKRNKHFVVEIPSKPASHHLHHHSHHNKQPAETTVASSQSIARPPEPAPQRPPVAKATSNPMQNRPNAAGNTAAPPPPPAPAATTPHVNNASSLPKYKEKVASGLKHELDRLQPDKSVTKEQGRKLRSQEATRFKSDLSAYFPDYDEVIGNDSKENREQHRFPSCSLTVCHVYMQRLNC